MKLIVIAQWLIVFSLLPLYSLWVLRVEDRAMEQTIVYAMEQTDTPVFLKFQSAWTTGAVCTLTEQQYSVIAVVYQTASETLMIEGQSVTVFHFVDAEPTTEQIKVLLREVPSTTMTCFSLYQQSSPLSLFVPLS